MPPQPGRVFAWHIYMPSAGNSFYDQENLNSKSQKAFITLVYHYVAHVSLQYKNYLTILSLLLLIKSMN